MNFDTSYFQNDIREGFYIPGMIKRSWAMQIEVLEIIKNICRRHNIRWFADCGTLIGTVRHSGFIPWDDDLDICMFRKDVNRFLEVAKDELPKEYRILSLATEPDYDNFLIRITNSSSIGLGNDYLNSHHGFPYNTGVDIFPLDYLYADEKKEEERHNRAKFAWKLGSELKNGTDKRTANELDAYVYANTGYHLDMSMEPSAAILRVVEKIFTECTSDESGKVAMMVFYTTYNNHVYPVKWYEKYIEMPFENTMINVPAAYDAVLTALYGGRWFIANRKGGLHDYPVYETQQNILLESGKSAPYIYVYQDNKESLTEARIKHRESVDQLEKLLSDLKNVHKSIIPGQQALEILETCQNVAITVGNAIEAKYGDGTEVVSALELYCEHVFKLYDLIAGDTLQDKELDIYIKYMDETVANAYEKYALLIKDHSTIIFMPVKASDWKYMEPLYDMYKADTNNQIKVMPIPYFDRVDDGSTGDQHYEYDMFDQSIPLVSVNDYSLKANHPDVIVIQNPFDEFESARTIHPYFYSTNLYECTDKLIYCQGFDIDCIEEGDEKAKAIAKNYVIAPGVINADEVYVPSENMKDVYLSILSDKVKGVSFESKIHVLDEYKNEVRSKNNGPKKLLLYAGVNDFYVDGEKSNSWFERIFTIFEDCAKLEELEIIWAVEDNIDEQLKASCEEFYDTYTRFVEKFKRACAGKIVSVADAKESLDEIAGFYGSPCLLMNLCIRKKIPVMMRNLEL